MPESLPDTKSSEQVLDVLRRHFADAPAETMRDKLEGVMLCVAIHKNVDMLEYHRTNPQTDRDLLLAFAAMMNEAAHLIEKPESQYENQKDDPKRKKINQRGISPYNIGRYGLEALNQAAGNPYDLSAETVAQLMQQARTLSDTFSKAAEIVDQLPEKAPYRVKKPTDHVAMPLARYLADIFFELTEQHPAVIPKTIPAPHSSEGSTTVAGGPFFDLVSDIFAALKLEAKPEHYAKTAQTEFKNSLKK